MPPRGLAALKARLRVRLRPHRRVPDLNSMLVGNAVRTNAHSIAKGTTVPWWAVPDDATMDYVPPRRRPRVAETGALRSGTRRRHHPLQPHLGVAVRRVGLLRRRLSGRGHRRHLVVRARRSAAPEHVGHLRVADHQRPRPGVHGGGDGLLTVEHYISGAWSVSKTYKLTVTTAPTTIGAFRTVTVKRNSPEVVTVRLGLDQSNGPVPAAVTVDLTLRRGALWVEGVMSRTAEAVTYLANQMGIYRNTAEAATTFTGGIRANAADASSGYYWLATSLSRRTT